MNPEITTLIENFLTENFYNESSTYRDLSLNLQRILNDSPLEAKDKFLILTAVACTLDFPQLHKLATDSLKILGTEETHIREASETAGIMGMNNVYYKFRSFVEPEAKDLYSRAGLRMQSMMKPLLGKQTYEMLCLAVSIINGCPSCVGSHEKALRDMSLETEKIHDLARLSAVSKGLHSLAKSRGLHEKNIPQ